MIGFKIDQAKGLFFDAPKVKRAVDAAARRVLSRFGAFVRTAARSSIRKRKRISEPDSPPSSHSGILKQYIYFGYSAGSRSVVIGPVVLRGGADMELSALEYGGQSSTTIQRGNRRKGRTKVVRRFTVKARPFMRPALSKELPKLPQMWRDSVKG